MNSSKIPRAHHNVYVVLLSPLVLNEAKFRRCNPEYDVTKPCVYVGMTGLDPDARFDKHKAGIRSNRFVQQYGERLLPALYECYNPMPYEAARDMEVEPRDQSARKGVWCLAGVSLRKDTHEKEYHRWRPLNSKNSRGRPSMKRFKVIALSATTFLALSLAFGLSQHKAAAQTAAAPRAVPKFEVDPSWPKLPAKWVFGQVSSVSVDCRWSRVDTAAAEHGAEPIRKGMRAPPVLEFDADGNFVQGWGGPGEGYDWPEIEHGIYVDPKGFVWIGGNGKTDNHLVKFTKAGKFVMQIGKKGASKGNTDTQNVKEAADIFRLCEDQRAVRGRRLRQQPRHRVRCRHRRIQADVGRVRQTSRVDQPKAEPPKVAGVRAHSRQRSGPGPRPATISARCTRRACRTTAWSMSPTAAASACRCSRSTANT